MVEIDYSVFRKQTLAAIELEQHAPWDLYVSAFCKNDRVQELFKLTPAKRKCWLVFPEFEIPPAELPHPSTDLHVVAPRARNEDDFVWALDDSGLFDGAQSICLDISGFLRPHLLFLLRFLDQNKQLEVVHAIYGEPNYYTKKEKTTFAYDDGRSDTVVRQVRGFEGTHKLGASAIDLLILGAGYDNHLVSRVCLEKDSAKKRLLLCFPPLRAEMYQESILRTDLASEDLGVPLGSPEHVSFHPANDPIEVANTLQDVVRKGRRKYGDDLNLYLCPLATKPQLLGFYLYYRCELSNAPASILFPFSSRYSSAESSGLGRIWLYALDFSLMRYIEGLVSP